MNNTLKKSLSLILAALLLLSSIPMTTAFASEIKYSGTLQNDLTWELDSDGTLTVSGEGWGISDCFFTPHAAPWFTFRDEVKKVVISEGISYIGANTFYGCGNLTSVEIPSTVVLIEADAFGECKSLKDISVSDKNLYLRIESHAFNGCDALESLDLNNEYVVFDEYSFFNCKNLKSVTLESRTKVGYKAFGYYFDEEKVAVSKATDLKIYGYKESFAEEYATEHGFTFVSRCNHDESKYKLVVGDEPYCHGYAEGDKYYCNECKKYVKGDWYLSPKHTDEDGDGYCENCEEQISGTLASGTFGDNLNWSYDADGTLKLSGTGEPYSYESSEDIPWFNYSYEIKTVEIENGITSIPDYAFCDCTNIASVDLPDSVVKIGYGAFWNCICMEEIKLPSKLEEIGDHAFASCTKLKELKLPTTLKKIGSTAFYDLRVPVLEIPEGVTEIGIETLTGLKCSAVSIPSTVEAAESLVLYNNINLKYIKVSSDNKAYTSVDGVLYNYDKTEIISYPQAKNASTFTIPDTVTRVGSYAFYECYKLESVILPKNLEDVDESAFSGCTQIEKIEFPKTLQTVGFNAFYDCLSLKIVFVPLSVYSIAAEAFGHYYDYAKQTPSTIDGFTIEANSNTCEAYYYAEMYGLSFKLIVCDHDYTCEVLWEGDCGTYGYEKYTCKKCTYTYYKNVEPTGDHKNLIDYPKLEPTCLYQGYTAGTYCLDCYTFATGREYIKKLPHTDSDGDGICDSCESNIQDLKFSEMMANFKLVMNYRFKDSEYAPDAAVFEYLYCVNEFDDYYDENENKFVISYTDFMSLVDKHFKNHSDMKDYLSEYMADDGETLKFYIGGRGDASRLVYTSSSDQGNDTYILRGVFIHFEDESSLGDITVSYTEKFRDYLGTEFEYTYSGTVDGDNIFEMKVQKIDGNYKIVSFEKGSHYINDGTLYKYDGESFSLYNSVEFDKDSGVSSVTNQLTTFTGENGLWNKRGNSLSFSVNTNTNYFITSVKVNDDNGETTLSENNGTYTVTPLGNAKITIKTAVPHTHSYTSEVTKAPTCTENGIRTYKCVNCEDSYTETIAMTGHVNTVKYPRIDPTCEHNGLEAGTYCKDCKKWISGREYINSISHSDKNNDGICDTCSKSMQDIEFSSIMSKFTFLTYYKFGTTEKAPDNLVFNYLYSVGELEKYFNEKTYKYELSYSDYMKLVDKHFANHSDMKAYLAENDCFADESGEKLSFYIGGTGDAVTLEYTSSTADGNGVYTLHGVMLSYYEQGNEGDKNTIGYKSSYIDAFGKETENVIYYNVLKTSVYEIKVKKTDFGYQILSFTNGDYFDYGGKHYIFEGDILVAHTHKYTSKVTTPATCKSEGVMTYTCSCGESYTETIPVDKSAHKTTAISAVAATCTKDGKTSGTKCSLCGKVIKAQTTVKAKGHTYKTTTTPATAKKEGSVVSKCTVCGAQTSTAIAKISSVKLSKTSFTYNGKAQKPTVTVKDSKGKTLKNGTDYTVKYPSGCKNVGQYTVTVTFKGNYSGKSTLTYTIVPKGTSISKLTAGSKQLTAKWSKQATQTSGYEVQYSTSKNMKSPKSVSVSNAKTTSVTLKGLKASKTYYVRIRTYKTVKVNGKNVKLYSAWSSVKNVKVKK